MNTMLEYESVHHLSSLCSHFIVYSLIINKNWSFLHSKMITVISFYAFSNQDRLHQAAYF